MTAKQQEPERAPQRSDQQRLEGIIGDRVMDLLGRPSEPHCARVRYLWNGHYRVNVFLGETTAFAHIAHSYFLTVDGAGAILTSAPAIRKQY